MRRKLLCLPSFRSTLRAGVTRSGQSAARLRPRREVVSVPTVSADDVRATDETAARRVGADDVIARPHREVGRRPGARAAGARTMDLAATRSFGIGHARPLFTTRSGRAHRCVHRFALLSSGASHDRTTGGVPVRGDHNRQRSSGRVPGPRIHLTGRIYGGRQGRPAHGGVRAGGGAAS